MLPGYHEAEQTSYIRITTTILKIMNISYLPVLFLNTSLQNRVKNYILNNRH